MWLVDEENLRLDTIQSPGQRWPHAGQALYSIEQIDTMTDASGTLVVWDYAGNESRYPIEFDAITLPEIVVAEQHNFGTLHPDSSVCTRDVPFEIRNDGDAELEITLQSLVQPSDAFSIDESVCSVFPIKIDAQSSFTLPCVCFESSELGDHSATLRIATNDQNKPVIDVTFRARVEEPVSVDEEDHESSFVVQSRDGALLVLVPARAESSSWTLVAMSGAIVKTGRLDGSNTTNLISTSGLSAGVYVLNVDSVGSRVITVMRDN